MRKVTAKGFEKSGRVGAVYFSTPGRDRPSMSRVAPLKTDWMP